MDGKNGFLYGIPSGARRVVKFHPLDKSLTEIGPDLGEVDSSGGVECLNHDNDTCSSVGDDLGDGYCKYIGTVVGYDDCLYGMP